MNFEFYEMHHSDLQKKSIQKGGREQLIRRKLATDDNERSFEVILDHERSYSVIKNRKVQNQAKNHLVQIKNFIIKIYK